MKCTNLVLLCTLLLASGLQVAYVCSAACYKITGSVQLLNFLSLWRAVCAAEHPHIYLRLNCTMCRASFHSNNSRRFCDSCLHNVYGNETMKKCCPPALFPGDKRKIREWDRDCANSHSGKGK